VEHWTANAVSPYEFRGYECEWKGLYHRRHCLVDRRGIRSWLEYVDTKDGHADGSRLYCRRGAQWNCIRHGRPDFGWGRNECGGNIRSCCEHLGFCGQPFDLSVSSGGCYARQQQDLRDLRKRWSIRRGHDLLVELCGRI